MKLILLSSILILVGCGKVGVSNSTSSELGSNRSVSGQPISSSDLENIEDICDALETKSQTLNALADTSYTFLYSSKECNDLAYNVPSDKAVTLVNQFGLYKFTESATTMFYFSDVETDNQGIMRPLCDNLATLKNPIEIDPLNFIFFSVNDVGDNCPETAGERCIRFDKATKTSTSDKNARIHTREWVRFRLQLPRLGFFTHRKLISEASCEENKFFGRTAVLKP